MQLALQAHARELRSAAAAEDAPPTTMKSSSSLRSLQCREPPEFAALSRHGASGNLGRLQDGGDSDEEHGGRPRRSGCCGPRKRPASLEEVVLGGKRRLMAVDRWSHRLDMMMSALVIISAANICIELELRGRSIGLSLDGSAAEAQYEDTMKFFSVFEQASNALFVLEMVYRIGKSRSAFFWDRIRRKADIMNSVDVFIVFMCSIDLYILPHVIRGTPDGTSGNFPTMRLLRILRLTRALRVLRVMTSLSKLRILLVTTANSFFSLFWSMTLVFLFIYGSALSMCQTLQPVVEDESVPMDLREWVFMWYGTASRAIWTLFLVTFSGGWPSYAQRLVEEVHVGYALFFVAYVWVVVFAVTRIITATFVKDTLQAASEDGEMILREQKAAKAKLACKLHELFEVADKSGDGIISLGEFRSVVTLPQAQSYFSSLDLQVSEACELFTMLDGGDGSISYEEFCSGVMRLKGQARALDVISTMRDCKRILRRFEALDHRIDGLQRSYAKL